METTKPLYSIGEIADFLGVEVYRIKYVIDSRQIPPTTRAGNYRLFNADALSRIRFELKQMASTKETH